MSGAALSTSLFPRYFLGTATYRGYGSLFKKTMNSIDHAAGRTYLLKSGPGYEASRLIGQVADRLIADGKSAEFIHSSCDLGRLEGVVFPGLKSCILDSNGPHSAEPRYPGLGQTVVSLYDCYDIGLLNRHNRFLRQTLDQAKELRERAGRYISAAGSLANDSYGIHCSCCNLDKALVLARRMASSLFPPAGQRGVEHLRFLQAISPDGNVFFEVTPALLCERIYAIEDEYGAASSVILGELRRLALEAGLSVITCPGVLSPHCQTDHLLIPALSLAFCTTNSRLPLTCATERQVHSRRFCDINEIKRHRTRLNFNRRAARELTKNAGFLMAEAQQVQAAADVVYDEALDARPLDDLCARLVYELTESPPRNGGLDV